MHPLDYFEWDLSTQRRFTGNVPEILEMCQKHNLCPLEYPWRDLFPETGKETPERMRERIFFLLPMGGMGVKGVMGIVPAARTEDVTQIDHWLSDVPRLHEEEMERLRENFRILHDFPGESEEIEMSTFVKVFVRLDDPLYPVPCWHEIDANTVYQDGEDVVQRIDGFETTRWPRGEGIWIGRAVFPRDPKKLEQLAQKVFGLESAEQDNAGEDSPTLNQEDH